MLMRSISGIRGLIGEDWTPEVLSRYTKVFLELMEAKSIIIARDSRESGLAFEQIICATCQWMGVKYATMGIVSTPTLEFAAGAGDYDAGIMISASHNPLQWNALKLVDHEGRFIGPETVARYLELLDAPDQKPWPAAPWHLDASAVQTETYESHLDAILAHDLIKVEAIRSKKYKVAIDPVNGAGGESLRDMLEQLGCEVFSVHEEPTGMFGRPPEPTNDALSDLSQLVLDHSCDLGIALDPDGDRCSLVDEKGQPMGEEQTLPLCADYVLAHQPGPVACNLSTSKALEIIARKYEQECSYSPVGERNVSLLLTKINAPIGGEGNGGVMLTDLQPCRDGLIAGALTLMWMTWMDSAVSEFSVEHPLPFMKKSKYEFPTEKLSILFDKFKAKWPDAKWNEEDGLRGDFADLSWCHLRASNTEPIVRLCCEALESTRADELEAELIQICSEAI